ncbi:hypothetical protein BRADI_1g21435v3 [Brachypodium distachyon]|uniref:Uncharacterized protein n=1 Tax=Brachypodium distachyon TaxID=15368 RepID=A0A2K2DKE6_BRADI|nr:hypothetical protein BRADI_1g21435v3 [Brachypodium distachyon]
MRVVGQRNFPGISEETVQYRQGAGTMLALCWAPVSSDARGNMDLKSQASLVKAATVCVSPEVLFRAAEFLVLPSSCSHVASPLDRRRHLYQQR